MHSRHPIAVYLQNVKAKFPHSSGHMENSEYIQYNYVQNVIKIDQVV